MTATQPDSDGTATQAKSGLTRRGVMRKTAIGIGATATAGYGIASDSGPVGNAQAVPPALLPAAAAVGVLAYGEYVAGPDEEEVADSLDWQAHVDEFTRAREEELNINELLASLSRDVQLVQNKAREDAIFAIYEQAVDSGSEADATAAAEEAIDEAYATVERSIFDSHSLRVNRFWDVVQLLSDDSDSDSKTYWLFDDGSADRMGIYSSYSVNTETDEKTLLDGSVIEATEFHFDNDDFDRYVRLTADPANEIAGAEEYYTGFAVDEPDPENYESVDEGLDVSYTLANVIRSREWIDLMQSLYDEHSSMMDEVSAMVDSYFQPAQDGEIDLHNMAGPRHLTDTASEAEDYQEAAMALRAMGYPLSDQVCTVSIADPDDLDEDGDPVTHERTGRLSWTAHSGNTLTVGSELDPDDIPGSIFFAYNEDHDDDTTTGEIRELTRPFTVESAEGAEGVTFEDRALVESETQLTTEEIEQLFAEHYQANEEARENVHETATGGGGGWSGLSTTDKGIVAVVAAAILGLVTR